MAAPPHLRPGTFYSEVLDNSYDGYPFEAVSGYMDPQSSNLLVRIGDEGKIVRVGSNGRWAQVAFKASNRPVAIIPCNTFVVGIVRKFGDYKINTDIPPTISSHVSGGSNHPNNILLDTIAGLVDAFNHPQLADLIGRGIKIKISDDTSRRNMKTTLQNIITPEALRVLSKPDFTIEDIRSLPQVQSKGTARGIYIIVCPDGSIYIGFSGKGFLIRFSGHRSDMNTTWPTKNPKVLALRKAGNFTMHILVEFTGNESVETQALAEQILICLMQSYCGFLLLPSNGDISDEVLNQTLDNHAHQITATIISRLAEDTFLRTGWKGFVWRSGSGAGQGLNVESPVCTGPHARLLWTKTVYPRQIVFRRGAVVARAKRAEKIDIVSLSFSYKDGSEGRHSFKVKHDTSRGLDVGTTVIAVFEVMKGNEPHPQAWARLPEIGCWGEWPLAQRVAFRIEWQDARTGQWWTRYEFISTWARPSPLYESGEFRPYNVAAMLWMYFTQHKKEELRDWEISKAPAMVREIQVDHLLQEITVRNCPPSEEKLLRSVMQTDHRMAERMRACGAKNVDGRFGVFGIEKPLMDRTKCDSCYAIAPGKSQKPKCKSVGNSNQCKECFIMGHPCSWTSTSELAFGSRLSLAVAPRPLELCDTQCHPIPPRTMLETIHSE